MKDRLLCYLATVLIYSAIAVFFIIEGIKRIRP
jgi:hypothetical protein